MDDLMGNADRMIGQVNMILVAESFLIKVFPLALGLAFILYGISNLFRQYKTYKKIGIISVTVGVLIIAIRVFISMFTTWLN